MLSNYTCFFLLDFQPCSENILNRSAKNFKTGLGVIDRILHDKGVSRMMTEY